MCAATSYLCTSDMLENFPFSFLLPEKKCFRQHGSIGWMRVPWISHMEGTVKNSFIFTLPYCARREGEVAQLCLHSEGTVTSRGTANMGPVVMSFLCPPFHPLGNGGFLELVDIPPQLCRGCTLGSLSLWACKRSYLVSYEIRKWAGIKAI